SKPRLRRARTEYAHFNLGWLLLETGDNAAAAHHFRAAAQLAPDRGGVYFGLGLALEGLGRHADAIRAFALEWLDDPRQSTSPAWEVPALARNVPAIRVETKTLYHGLHALDSRAAMAEAWTRLSWGETVDPRELRAGF